MSCLQMIKHKKQVIQSSLKPYMADSNAGRFIKFGFTLTSLKRILATIDNNSFGIIPVTDRDSNLCGYLT